MHLRKFVLIKYLVILLFAFELLAPAFFDESLSSSENSGSMLTFRTEINHVDLLGTLFIEESGSTERAEKYDANHACCMEIFSTLVQFEPATITWLLPNEKNNSQPALFTLHRILRI